MAFELVKFAVMEFVWFVFRCNDFWVSGLIINNSNKKWIHQGRISFSVGESNIGVLEIFCFYVGSEATVDFFLVQGI